MSCPNSQHDRATLVPALVRNATYIRVATYVYKSIISEFYKSIIRCCQHWSVTLISNADPDGQDEELREQTHGGQDAIERSSGQRASPQGAQVPTRHGRPARNPEVPKEY